MNTFTHIYVYITRYIIDIYIYIYIYAHAYGHKYKIDLAEYVGSFVPTNYILFQGSTPGMASSQNVLKVVGTH